MSKLVKHQLLLIRIEPKIFMSSVASLISIPLVVFCHLNLFRISILEFRYYEKIMAKQGPFLVL